MLTLRMEGKEIGRGCSCAVGRIGADSPSNGGSRRLRREVPMKGAAPTSVVLRGLLPNQQVEPTAQQRRSACCWVPVALRTPAAAHLHR